MRVLLSPCSAYHTLAAGCNVTGRFFLCAHNKPVAMPRPRGVPSIAIYENAARGGALVVLFGRLAGVDAAKRPATALYALAMQR